MYFTGYQYSTAIVDKKKNSVFLGEPFKGKVIIIGAGAGGLSAGYLLAQQGTDFEILEASENYGGRIKINQEFAPELFGFDDKDGSHSGSEVE